MACALARQKGQLNVTLLLRDPYVCKDINERHVNPRYLKVRYLLCHEFSGACGSCHLQPMPDTSNLYTIWYELQCYMQEYTLPNNVIATTSFVEAIQGAQYAIHAVPVQHSRKFLESIAVSTPPSPHSGAD